MSLVKKAQQIISSIVKNLVHNNIQVIDATIGNGNDTIFLAKLVDNAGHVYGFDIQQNAIDTTTKLLITHQLTHNVTLLRSGHENLVAALDPFDVTNCYVIMFNLGYLPRSDKTVVTRSETSLSAIQQSLSLLRPGGVISVLAYPGHQGGFEETNQVRTLMESLSPIDYQSQHYLSNAISPNSPELFILEKQPLTYRLTYRLT